MLIVSNASLLYGPVDDSSYVMGVAASPSAQVNDTETVWLDAYHYPGYPTVYSQNPLANGTTYKITIEGTWSIWPSASWNDANNPPAGPFEAAPMYPGLGGEKTGPVGCDGMWGFAYIHSQDINWTLPWYFTIMISLDGGSFVLEKRPVPDVYNPMHKYEITVVGQGEIVGFRISDYDSSDNYGMLKIVIELDQDADGDGLLDKWEKNGVDSDNDGTTDLVLNGADWQHKDIFVEVDYMQGRMPDPLALKDVENAFSRSPALNPDGTTGISLHVLLDEQCFWNIGTRVWVDFDAIKSNYFGTRADRNSPNKAAILEARKQVSHYCLFVHQLEFNDTGSWTFDKASGVAELPGNDFMVSLGHAGGGSRLEQASVFMHELGHNLNLCHGGRDDVNYKPNYLSIMNYMFQFNYRYPNRPMDYSRIELPALDESDLDEMEGVGVDYVPAGNGGWLFTCYKDQTRNKTVTAMLRPIDWDGDHQYNSSVRANVNNCTDWRYKSKPDELLNGSNDWGNIILPFQSSSNFADGAHGESPEEITTDAMMAMKESAQNYHEVALINATPSSTIVEKDSILDIVVTSVNLGANNETADLSVYAGTTLIAQKAISLEGCNITSTSLRCDISTVPKGNQMVTIRLSQVPGEADAIDNNYTYGTIEFTVEAAPPDTGSSWPLMLGVSAAVIIVAAMALFVILRKRGKKGV